MNDLLSWGFFVFAWRKTSYVKYKQKGQAAGSDKKRKFV